MKSGTEKNRKKTKSMPVLAEDDSGLAVYRCRFCSQLFLTSTTPPAPPNPPLNAWHNSGCLLGASGYSDLVAIVYSEHPGYPEPPEKGGAG